MDKKTIKTLINYFLENEARECIKVENIVDGWSTGVIKEVAYIIKMNKDIKITAIPLSFDLVALEIAEEKFCLKDSELFDKIKEIVLKEEKNEN